MALKLIFALLEMTGASLVPHAIPHLGSLLFLMCPPKSAHLAVWMQESSSNRPASCGGLSHDRIVTFLPCLGW